MSIFGSLNSGFRSTRGKSKVRFHIPLKLFISFLYIAEHKIQGDTLCMLDLDALKLFGITTIGQRLSILKSIYFLKVANDIPFSEDDYIPPCMSSQ